MLGGQYNFGPTLLLRYKANGTLDSTFGNNGIDTVTIAGSTSSTINHLALQQDGKIIVCINAVYIENNKYTYHTSIARYNANGGLDKSYGINGIFSNKNSSADTLVFVNIAVESNGKIVAGGSHTVNAEGYFGIVKYLSNGFDSSFGKME